MKKQRCIAQPLIIDYPMTASGTRASAAMSALCLHHRANNQKAKFHQLKTISTANYMLSASYTPSLSTRPSHASLCAKPWEHLLLLPMRAEAHSEDGIPTKATIVYAALIDLHYSNFCIVHRACFATPMSFWLGLEPP